CGIKFLSRDTFKCHMLIHTGEKPFSCHYCDFSFRSSRRLYDHIRKVHNIKPYSCIKCDEKFDKHVFLKEHMTTHVEVTDDQIETEAISNGVDEEPVEMKGDPIDEFADVKREDPFDDDEPMHAFADIEHDELIADVFCPSTGTSHSLDESTIAPSSEMETNMNGAGAPAKKCNRSCTLCEEKTSSWILTSIGLEKLTPEQREKIENLAEKFRLPLCRQHLKEQQVLRPISNTSNRVGPRIGNSTHKRLGAGVSPTVNELEPPRMIRVLPTTSVNEIRKVAFYGPCDICGQLAFPFLISPEDPSAARYFFSNLVGLTPKQMELAAIWVFTRNRRAIICRRHYREETTHCFSVAGLGGKGIGPRRVRVYPCKMAAPPIDHRDYLGWEAFEDESRSENSNMHGKMYQMLPIDHRNYLSWESFEDEDESREEGINMNGKETEGSSALKKRHPDESRDEKTPSMTSI
ncbi:hypothetical protein PMAYCL1PPCAC_27839, partial [Pristionchus mayeri]